MNSALDISLRRQYADTQTGDMVIYCVICDAPVVDSQPGREGHQNRLGHWPEERKRA